MDEPYTQRKRIPQTARKTLENTFHRHREHPYITQDELKELVTLTGLTIRQVRTFFANARARRLPFALSSGPSHQNTTDLRNHLGPPKKPIEESLSSSSEDEEMPDIGLWRTTKMSQERQQQHPTASLFPNSFVASMECASTQSADPLHKPGPRRGRRRQCEPTSKQLPSVARRPSSPSRQYQCTFCTIDFAQKYDWRRHEESVHFPQKEWVCLPDGPLDEHLDCIFCGKPHPEKQHLEYHKSILCSETPRTQRAFLRKDKLIQHIKQLHSCQPPKTIKEWCRLIDRDVKMICGLCMQIVPDWTSRAEHIASHFNDGIGMDMWLLGRSGGIISPDVIPTGDTLRRVASYYTATTSTTGKITCEFCPNRFKYPSNLILHRRQTHNTYRIEDTSKEHWPSLTRLNPLDAAFLTADMELIDIQEEDTSQASRKPLDRTTQASVQASNEHTLYHPSQPEHITYPSAEKNPPFRSSVSETGYTSILNRRNPALGFAPASPNTHRSSTPPSHTHPNKYPPSSTDPHPQFHPYYPPHTPTKNHTYPLFLPSLLPIPHFAPSYSYTPLSQDQPRKQPHGPITLTTEEVRAKVQTFRSRGRDETRYPTHGMLHGIEQHEGDAQTPWPSPYENPPRQ
ncbi:hypothetical protein P280DRAFT_35939 [Massarina eburnea CBS 473.64]|uniref:Homeobox domain-containing protein n=1 Tax=Massarina eburnea CBS 473.64 TaxID=1395130 RepID=A0A6A6RYX5_9PLEO|nr:hypothetical protein P280DRAFT_35939 [Massarina eburnea CBS 473.64]